MADSRALLLGLAFLGFGLPLFLAAFGFCGFIFGVLVAHSRFRVLNSSAAG